MGRDHEVVDVPGIPEGQFSIHAPAWGATRTGRFFLFYAFVSIHAPAWGATLVIVVANSDVSFQSTRPRGARPGSYESIGPATRVSIHAPAWGATWTTGFDKTFSKVSIHAPAWGATACNRGSIYSARFQSTRPRGARRSCRVEIGVYKSFNPRARVGRDISRKFLVVRQVVSIHAPAWGATVETLLSGHVRRVSIHAPRGARRPCGIGWKYDIVSIHAPAWGATGLLAKSRPQHHRFNPRARVGRDTPPYTTRATIVSFQSTRPRGARHFHRGGYEVFELFQSTRRVGRDSCRFSSL